MKIFKVCTFHYGDTYHIPHWNYLVESSSYSDDDFFIFSFMVWEYQFLVEALNFWLLDINAFSAQANYGQIQEYRAS